MNVSIWATLGIEATRERADIRRAYAAKLKVTNPEDDPAGFQTLRAAYERALAYAGPPERSTPRPKADPPPDEDGDNLVVEVERPKLRRRSPPKPTEIEGPPDDGESDPKPRTHDWRPADEPGETPSGPRRREWRPPDPPVRRPIRRERSHVAPPLSPPTEPDPAEVALAALRRDLINALGNPATTPAELRQILEALLASPALMSVDQHAQTEGWLAGLIGFSQPRTDPLIEPAVAFFHWDEGRVGPKSNVGAKVVARRDDLKFRASARLAGSPFQPAFHALTRRPRTWGLLANRITPGLDEKVRRLLGIVRTERPGLMSTLEPRAVAWWEAHLSRPRLGPIAIWVVLVLPALLAFNIGEQTGAAHSLTNLAVDYVLALAAVAALVLARLYGIEWPRRIWRERWARDAPAWVWFAWAPALVALVLAAAAIPASLPASIILAAIAAPLAYWPAIVAEPDRRKGTRYPWQVRSAFSFTYLAIFWLVSAFGLPNPVWLQMSLPVLAGMLGFVLGEGTLLAAWRQRLSARLRRGSLVGLATVALLTAALLLVGWREPLLRALAAAMVVGAVLVHKTPAGELAGGRFRFRYYVMVFSWVGWFVAVALFEPAPEKLSGLTVSGLWLLTGVLVTCWAAFEPPERKPRRVAKPA